MKGTAVTRRMAPQPFSVFPSLLMWYTKNEIFQFVLSMSQKFLLMD